MRLEGFIKIWRKVLETYLLQSPQLWTIFSYLLLRANYMPTKQEFWSKNYDLKPGQLIISRPQISDFLHISIPTIKNCLNSLQRHKIIIKNTLLNRGMIITVTNWNIYQSKKYKLKIPKGFIKIWRKLLETDLLQSPELWTVFSYLLLIANYMPNEQKFGSKTYDLAPGELIISRRLISDFLNIPIVRVKSCLNLLEKRQRIERNTLGRGMLINITNWETYQDKKNKIIPVSKLQSDKLQDECPSESQLVTGLLTGLTHNIAKPAPYLNQPKNPLLTGSKSAPPFIPLLDKKKRIKERKDVFKKEKNELKHKIKNMTEDQKKKFQEYINEHATPFEKTKSKLVQELYIESFLKEKGLNNE